MRSCIIVFWHKNETGLINIINMVHGVETEPMGAPPLKHVPTGARRLCSQVLTTVLLSICSNPTDINRWGRLFRFAPSVLSAPKTTGQNRNLGDLVKTRAEAFTEFVPGITQVGNSDHT